MLKGEQYSNVGKFWLATDHNYAFRMSSACQLQKKDTANWQYPFCAFMFYMSITENHCWLGEPSQMMHRDKPLHGG